MDGSLGALQRQSFSVISPAAASVEQKEPQQSLQITRGLPHGGGWPGFTALTAGCLIIVIIAVIKGMVLTHPADPCSYPGGPQTARNDQGAGFLVRPLGWVVCIALDSIQYLDS